MIRTLAGTFIMSAVLAVVGAQSAHGQEWQLVNGVARDVGVGADGTVWIIGKKPMPGGFRILRRNNNAWVEVPGGAERIAVGPKGNAWVVNNARKIQHYNGSAWVTVGGTARDIGVGANGTIWVIGNTVEAGGYDIYRSTDKGASWTKIPGSAVRVSVDPQGNAWVVNNTNNIFRFDGSKWVQLTGAATDVGIGADGAAWVIGTDNGIYRWENNNWAKKTGAAAQIAAGPNGIVWFVNQENQIYAATVTAAATNVQAAVDIPQPTLIASPPPSQPVVIPTPNLNVTPPASDAAGPVNWLLTDGAARDVGVGADGSVWVIGTNPVPGGYPIYRRINNTWTNVPGGAERVAVDPQGNAWVVNSTQTIFRYDGTKWVTVPGAARDVGVGANGTVWVIGNNVEAGGFGIYRSTDKGASWTKIPGSAVRVSVDPQGNAWVVNNTNNIFRFDGSNWVQLTGAATDVGIGSDGAAWVIGTDSGIYRWESNNWAKKPGGAAQIAAGPNGAVWLVNQGNQIFQAQAAAPAGGSIALQGDTISIPVNVPVGSGGTTVPPPLIVSGGPAPLPYTIGAVGTSQTTCGVSGKGLCSLAPAKLASNADINCPSGSFPDLGRSACFSCPDGFTRSIHAVDNYKACQKQDSSIQHALLAASYKGPLCGDGTFHDPIRGGECYSCPGGYNRSAAHIDAANACYVPIHESFSAVTHHKSTIWPHECSAGTFWDAYNGGNCYSCPSGYGRTAYAVWDAKACAKMVGEQQARATLVKKAECGPGEFYDPKIQGEQNFARGGGCWTCPTGTDRTIHPVDSGQACERAPGVQWASTTRVRGMTCEPNEIFDPVNSADSNVASALATRNANSSSPVTAKTSGGTCWTCPAGHKRTSGAVYGGWACEPPGIGWQPAPYNQPGLFGLWGPGRSPANSAVEAVALKLVTERTLINTIIRDLQATGTAPANFSQTAWDEIGSRPQDSAILNMAVFSRVVAAANNPASSTADERALLEDVIQQITRFRVFMAQDALDAYHAWKAGESYREGMYLRSQLQVMTDIGEVPPDFEDITAQSIMGSLGAAAAANTAIYLTMSSSQVFKLLFPYAARVIKEAIVAASVKAGAELGGKALTTAVTAANSAAGAAISIGPQIIVTFAMVVLQVAIEQQIAIAEAEPKLRSNLTNAQAFRADFPRLMSTAEGSTQAQSYWSMLMAGPAPRVDGTRPSAIVPLNMPAFAQAAALAKQSLVAAN